MKKETREWIKIALEDLQSAEILLKENISRIDLNNILEEIGYKTPISEEEAIFLNSIYRFRYPPDLGLLPKGEPIKEDAERALNLAKLTIEWIRELHMLE